MEDRAKQIMSLFGLVKAGGAARDQLVEMGADEEQQANDSEHKKCVVYLTLKTLQEPKSPYLFAHPQTIFQRPHGNGPVEISTEQQQH